MSPLPAAAGTHTHSDTLSHTHTHTGLDPHRRPHTMLLTLLFWLRRQQGGSMPKYGKRAVERSGVRANQRRAGHRRSSVWRTYGIPLTQEPLEACVLNISRQRRASRGAITGWKGLKIGAAWRCRGVYDWKCRYYRRLQQASVLLCDRAGKKQVTFVFIVKKISGNKTWRLWKSGRITANIHSPSKIFIWFHVLCRLLITRSSADHIKYEPSPNSPDVHLYYWCNFNSFCIDVSPVKKE